MARGSLPEALLSGDIGGTRARLRLCDRAGENILHEATLPSAAYASLEALLAEYLERRRVRVVSAVLGIAGPVVHGVSRTTNLAWIVDERRLARTLGIPVVRLINDMAAAGVGCTILKSDKVEPVRGGRIRGAQSCAVLAAGTGLGEALLIQHEEAQVLVPGEGGHTDFGPRNTEEIALLGFLRASLAPDRSGHVSYERIVSGPGIGLLYDFQLARSGLVEPAAVRRRLATGDRGPAITALGLSGRSAAAARALEMFASIFGAEAGNLVLKGLATGGVYLTGRIARAVIPPHRAAFLAAFADKGRMRRLLAKVPVSIVTDERVGLTGAAHLAARLAAG